MGILVYAVVLIAIAATACSEGVSSEVTTTQIPTSPSPSSSSAGGNAQYPDVVAVEITENADGTYRFDVTISSSYDSPERYADAWRVIGSDGTEFGIRELLHDHSSEQPFTRSLDQVEIPPDLTEVTVEGRDLINGWGGQTMKVQLPGRN